MCHSMIILRQKLQNPFIWKCLYNFKVSSGYRTEQATTQFNRLDPSIPSQQNIIEKIKQETNYVTELKG